MSTIVFINPSAEKSSLGTAWQSEILPALKGRTNAYSPRLVAMVLAAITPAEHRFIFIDEDIEDVDFGMDADLVAIAAMTEQSSRAYLVAGEFRKRGITVVIGGIHAAVASEEVAAHCDVLMLGEGEHTWPALLEDFARGEVKPVYNAKDYPPVEVLISPKVDIINHDAYVSYPIQATRGCPYDCDFCSIKHSSGHRYRMKPVEQVVREIREYEKYNKPGIGNTIKKSYFFVDDNLYVNREYVKELMTAMRGLNIHWDAQGTINIAQDDEILTLMAECGCRSLGIGFESISPETLKEANKPKVNDIKDYSEAIRNIAKKGIIPTGYFVFGFDTDDVTVFRKTLEFISDSDLVQALISVLTPYKGTRLYDRLAPRVFEVSPYLYNSWNCVFTPQLMTAAQLQSGAHWVGKSVSDLEFMKKQLKKFWNYGPWKNNPPLTLFERILLIYAGFLLGLRGLWKYQRFAFWAATQKNAADLQTVIWSMRRNEISKAAPKNAKNPE
ncbi:MAG: B12-binding domain-containing radical SAM protein [Clostridiales bacterium]|nr:B12-binding domain-containing radical SAM protein [Clostridiales bacterium]